LIFLPIVQRDGTKFPREWHQMEKYKDIHRLSPPIRLKINRVGVKDVKKQITREFNGNLEILNVKINAYIDIPATLKGAHISRNLEAINEIIEETIKGKTTSIEDFCVDLAKKLLEKHEYASNSEVTVEAEYPVEKNTPATNLPTQQMYIIHAGALVWKEKEKVEVKKWIGIETEGLTVCPCAQELVKNYVKQKLLNMNLRENLVNTIVEAIPIASHLQRGKALLLVYVQEHEKIDLKDLIEIVESSFSSPIFDLLKRPDEQQLLINAYKNPKFAEDVVRTMLKNFLEKYGNKLSDNTLLIAQQESYESIHGHNVYAERVLTLKELKEEVDG